MLTSRGGTRYRLRKPVFRCVCILLCALLSPAFASADWHQQQLDLMGTRVSLELWHKDATLAAGCGEQVFDEMRRIEALMSTYLDSSEISHINNNAAISALEISAEMHQILEKSLYFSRISDGAFDITYASVGYAYDYRNRQQPDRASVAAKLPAIDYRHVELGKNRVRFLHSGVRINLGGIAKGYAVDRAIDIVSQCGISQAMISAGGDSRIIGDRGGRPWMIGIQHPRDSSAIALRVPLSETAVSTSGDYERFFIEDGERIHHIIDPTTGRSAKNSWSATVTGPNAMTTDALSTTIFILGAVKGLALIESLDGIDAIIIDSAGKLHYSSGFETPETDG
ncbi:MAG: FAD:protein FMN transferase [Gammaproteobacteria bacterium]|nr:FAD:protein FMN transferase [Gammaproteobacteria bacterium]